MHNRLLQYERVYSNGNIEMGIGNGMHVSNFK